MSGIFPICAKAEPIVVEGQTYRLRRLGLKDGFELLGLANDIGTWGYAAGETRFAEVFGNTLVDPKKEKARKIFQSIITAMLGIDITQKRIYAWIASTLGKEIEGEPTVAITGDDLEDPNQFPLDAAIDLVENLSKHPDLESFFAKLKKQSDNPLVKLVQDSQKDLEETTPEPSSDQTDGNT